MTPMATAPMAITVAPMAVTPNVRATPVPTERDPVDRSGAGLGRGRQADAGRRLDGGYRHAKCHKACRRGCNKFGLHPDLHGSNVCVRPSRGTTPAPASPWRNALKLGSNTLSITWMTPFACI